MGTLGIGAGGMELALFSDAFPFLGIGWRTSALVPMCWSTNEMGARNLLCCRDVLVLRNNRTRSTKRHRKRPLKRRVRGNILNMNRLRGTHLRREDCKTRRSKVFPPCFPHCLVGKRIQDSNAPKGCD